MDELIKINYDGDQPVVSGRDLHKFLEVGTKYADWFKRMCEYGFAEYVDFAVIPIFEKDDTAFGGQRKSIDHALTIDMAKEIAMLQRNEKGKLARQYFILIEKAWNSPEQVMARALRFADQEINKLQQISSNQQARIAEMRPKEIFADAVSASSTSILVGELAKILKQNGIDMGQNRLFEWLRCNGYLIRRKGTDYNMPTQYSMELGLFEIKETSVAHSDGHVAIHKTAKVTGKGQIYFVNKFKVGETA